MITLDYCLKHMLNYGCISADIEQIPKQPKYI